MKIPTMSKGLFFRFTIRHAVNYLYKKNIKDSVETRAAPQTITKELAGVLVWLADKLFDKHIDISNKQMSDAFWKAGDYFYQRAKEKGERL